jgi:hypothetical protein
MVRRTVCLLVFAGYVFGQAKVTPEKETAVKADLAG